LNSDCRSAHALVLFTGEPAANILLDHNTTSS